MGHNTCQKSHIFSPCRALQYKPGKYLHFYPPQDAIVLKKLAEYLKTSLPSSPLCFSVSGHGGTRKAVDTIQQAKGGWYLKTDVSDYYASIDLHLMMLKLHHYLPQDKALMRLLYKALYRLNAHYHQVEKGLPRGSALSHCLGNFYLYELDKIFEGRDTQTYVRYMDDIVVRATSRGAIRRADKTIKAFFESHKLNGAYHKSFIGRTTQPIRFLGKTLDWGSE